MSENILIILLFAIVVVFYFVFGLNKHIIKGAVGESRVAKRLNKLRRKEYAILNDVLIRTSRGSSQIDHIIVSINGIFVIETKNYTGWIHGHQNSEYWTQTIYKKKQKFRNPIKQNWAHIYALKEVLSDFKQVKYHPIIVFAGSAELKNITSEIPVIYDHQILRTIASKIGIANLSVEQVNTIAVKLNEVNLKDRKAKREHVYKVKNQAYERRRSEKSKICLSCGGDLVIRHSQYGKFYGCSNFPKCTFKLSYKSR